MRGSKFAETAGYAYQLNSILTHLPVQTCCAVLRLFGKLHDKQKFADGKFFISHLSGTNFAVGQ